MNKNLCYISREKIRLYLLKPGAKHSSEFFDVGYTPYMYKELEDDIKSQFDYNMAIDFREAYDGAMSFSVIMILGMVKMKSFRTIWQVDNDEAIPRLITAYRED